MKVYLFLLLLFVNSVLAMDFTEIIKVQMAGQCASINYEENYYSCSRHYTGDTVASALTGTSVGKDYFKAVEYFERACNHEYAPGCIDLGKMYLKGQGVRQDKHKAVQLFQKTVQLYQKACDNGSASGCSSLGAIYYAGNYVEQDFQKAVQLYQKACDGGAISSCHDLGNIYANGKSVKQDKSKAKEFFGKECDMKSQQGCAEYKKLNEQGY